MRLVETPANFPARCFVTAREEDPKGFVDTDAAFDGAHLYLCVDIAREVGKTAGLVTPEELAHVTEQNHELAAENETLVQENVQLRAFRDSIHVIKSAGFRPEKKRGPKPQEK